MDAPRLYLDTADLIALGDGKVDAELATNLMRECERTGTLLVVSLWHVADARNADTDGRERIFDAVDRFPQRALATLGDEGIALLRIPSLAALIREHGDDVQILYDHVNHATGLMQSSPPRTGLPQWLVNLSGRVLLHAIQNAQSRDEAMTLARAHLHKERRRILPERVEAMLTVIDQMFQLEQAGVWEPETLAQAFTVREVSTVHSGTLGEHISALLEQRRRGQLDRAVQNGDIADRHHVQFAPYVDVFTGDWDICTWLNEWRTKVSYERAVVPIGSRHLGEVVATLAQYESMTAVI